MAIPTTHVQPGDLIRADLMNSIVAALGDLDIRLSALEGASPPSTGPYPQVVITSVSPTTPHVGDTVTITGHNFDFSVAAAVVKFGSVTVPNFNIAASSDTQLVFTVPNLGLLPATGQSMTMTVSNFGTQATRVITVLPKPQVFQGNVDIDYVSGSTLTPGSTAIIRFTATSDGSPAVTVSLTAQAPGFPGLEILDNQTPPQPIPGGQITVPALGQVPFSVGVPIPSTAAIGSTFNLTVNGSGPGVTSSRVKQLTVGQSGPVEDATIPSLDIRGIDGGTLSGSAIQVAPGNTAELTVEVAFTQVDNYDVTVALEPASTQWTLTTDVTTPTAITPSYTIDASDLVTGLTTRTFLVDLTPAAGATDQPLLHIVAKHKGATLTRDLIAQLDL